MLITTAGCKKKGDAADAAADAMADAAVEDAATAAVEDAGVEAAAPLVTAKPTATAAPATIVGLPKTCTDSKGGLGTVTFAVSGTNVTITSSTGKAKATCTKKDETTLLCDWLDKDGKPAASGRKVSYGKGKTIGGNYDSKSIFSCPPQ
jgi:hypothetical protein